MTIQSQAKARARAAKFDLAANLTTAQALGLKVPAAVPLQATKVVE